MKRLLLSLAFLFMTNNLSAADVGDSDLDYSRQLQKVEKDYIEAESEIVKLKTALTRWTAKYNDAKKDLEKCLTRGANCSGDALKTLRENLDFFKKQITDREEGINKSNSVLESLRDSKAYAENKAKQVKERAATVGAQFMDIKITVLNKNIDLNELEKKYDQQEMGAYIKYKIGLTLSSQAICKSVKRCGEPAGVASDKNKVGENDLKDIFPEGATFPTMDFWKIQLERGKAKPAEKAAAAK